MPVFPTATPGTLSPTEWVTPDQVAADGRVLGLTLPTGVTWDMICTFASTWLYYQSGQRYGLRTDTIRPGYDCAGRGGLGSSWGSSTWFSRFWPEGGLDSAQPSNVIVLPGNGPIAAASITVVVDGVTLIPQGQAGEQWHLYDGRRLVRTVDPATNVSLPWPTWQWIARAAGQPGTFSVTYAHGTPVPPDGLFAAVELAVEIGLAKANKATKLPQRTSHVVRQGISIDLVSDPKLMGFRDVPIVAAWLDCVNPHGLLRQASIRSVDSLRANVG